MIGLGSRSIWIDEGATVALARMSWRDFGHALWTYEANMAFYYLLVRGWLVFGDSERILRGLSVVCALAAIVALYFLARRIGGTQLGLIASALLSVHMDHVWYSQEARSYSLLVLLTILSTHAFLWAADAPDSRRRWAVYVLVTVLAGYAHFFGVLVPLGQWAALGGGRLGRIGGRLVLGVLAAVGILWSPLAVFVLRHESGQLSWLWRPTAGDVLLTVASFCGYNALLFIVLLVGLAKAAAALRRDDARAFHLRMLGLSVVLPPLLVLAASLTVQPFFFYRYFAPCEPAAVLLGAMMLTPPEGASRRRIFLTGALILLTLALSVTITLGSREQRDGLSGDWRSATEYVLARREAGDVIVFDIAAGFDPYRYYCDRVPSSRLPLPLPVVAFPTKSQLASANPMPSRTEIEGTLSTAHRVWIVGHQARSAGARSTALAPFHVKEHARYPGIVPKMDVTVALYERD
jgi:mannosyltransferase